MGAGEGRRKSRVKDMDNHWNRGVVLGLAFVLTLGACETGSEESEKYVTYSTLSDTERQEIRSTLGPFTANRYSPADVLKVFSVIEEEVLRLYPYSAVIGDFSLSNGALDMTETLPKSDENGHFVEGGGFILFEEEYNDGKGTITSGDAFKRNREFLVGSIEDFDYYDSQVTENALDGYRDKLMRVSISSDLEYQETAWHQQVAGTSILLDEALVSPLEKASFTYDSHPTLKIEIQGGSAYSEQEFQRTKILDKQGYHKETRFNSTGNITGYVTFYRPSSEGLEDNDDELGESEDETLENNVLERVTSVTTEDDYTPIMMDTEGIEMNIRVRTTTDTTSRVDAGTGALFSRTSETQETRFVSFGPRKGLELEALRSGELGWRQDYTETVHSTVTDQRVYATDSPSLLTCTDSECPPPYECRQGFGTQKRCLPLLGSSSCGGNQVSYGLSEGGDEVCQDPVTGEGSQRILKTTSDPVSRNDISLWKSTEESYSSTFSEDDNGQLEERRESSGVAWLTDRIEVDPDFDRVFFSHKGEVGEEIRETTQLLGADLTGVQSTWDLLIERGTHTFWGEDELIVNGSHTLSQGSLANEQTASYGVGSDTQGAYNLELNGMKQRVSSEEWLYAILLEGLQSSFQKEDPAEAP